MEELGELSLFQVTGTKTRAELLDFLSKNPGKTFYGTELAKNIDTAPAVLSRAIVKLVEGGYVDCKNIGAMKFYSINSKKIEEEAQKLISLTRGENADPASGKNNKP